MKIALNAYEESDSFAKVEVGLEEENTSAVLGFLAVWLKMEDGEITVKVKGVNTTNKPNVVFVIEEVV